MGTALGIDLGTTFLRAAWGEDGRVQPVQLSPWSIEAPAMTHLTGTDESTWVSGPAARTAGRATGLVRYAKRDLPSGQPLTIGHVAVMPERVLGHQLMWAYEAAVTHLERLPDRLAVTYPASWSEAAVQRLMSQTVGVGLPPVTMMTEAEAAAAALLSDSEEGQGLHADGSWVVVVDLGGGGLDISALQARSGGSHRVGRALHDDQLAGTELTDAVADHLARTRVEVAELAPADGFELARWALDNATTVDERQFVLPNSGPTAPLSVTRAEIEQVAMPVMDEVVDLVRQIMADVGLGADAVAGVLLAGSAARAPLLGLRLRERLGVKTLLAGDPGQCVSRGAAIRASAVGPGPTDRAPADLRPPPEPGRLAWGPSPSSASPESEGFGQRLDRTSPTPPATDPGPAPDRSLVEQPVSTVSRFREAGARTFNDPPSEHAEVDQTGVAELPPDRRLAVVAAVLVVALIGLVVAGRLLLGG